MARLTGEEDPVPLKSLGDGVVRVFEIALALEVAAFGGEDRDSEGAPQINEPAKLLLIDEIENGIHHSLHAEVWRALAALAVLHDVQVVATSHSWDCMRGFQEALSADEEADGLVIRLEEVEGEKQTGAVIVDRDALPIIIRDSIEVR